MGWCGGRKVFLGFAPSRILHDLSVADTYDEEHGTGYQRPIHVSHSLEFRRYIQLPGSTTIPLTLNLRALEHPALSFSENVDGTATLSVTSPAKVFAQVDCQHRLGHLGDLEVPLAFMAFVGLTLDEERAIFTTINSKAKGLNTSLLDHNIAQLSQDLATQDPELYIALRLADDSDSPWKGLLSKGGKSSIGLKRTASLRMMKLALRGFHREAKIERSHAPEQVTKNLKDFWRAVSVVFAHEWLAPRSHLLTKGVGIYSLTSLAGELVRDAHRLKLEPTEEYFRGVLSDYFFDFDWTPDGTLEALGGTQGAMRAFRLLREHRRVKQKRENPWHTRTFS